MNVLTVDQFARCTGATLLRASPRLAPYMRFMELYAIATPLRQIMLLANVGEESGGFQYQEEIWGPSEAQNGYEGRVDLGNVHPGDGKLYRGRGDLETTGRGNYRALTVRLRKRFPLLQVPDFETDPDKLLEPEWAALSACDYVDMKSANAQADLGHFDHYCDLVNRGRLTAAVGDANGYAKRKALYLAGLSALGML